MSSTGAISTTAVSLEQMAIFVYAAVNMNFLKGETIVDLGSF